MLRQEPKNQTAVVSEGRLGVLASLFDGVDGIRTYFVYSAEGLVGEYDASGSELRTYGWAPQSRLGTDPFFVKIGSQYYWYQNDHQGTPQKIITSSGQVVWSATYDSFGNAQIGVEVITSNLRFPGQYYDAETGLHYNLNRYYDPATGRYLRTDPYGEGLNLYAYCFSNPLTLIDPLGLCVYQYTPPKLMQAGLGYLSDLLASASPTNPVTMAAFAILKAFVDLGYGVVSSPEALVVQILDFVQDPLNPVKIPVLGPLGEALGVTTAMMLEDPNAVTISRAVGAASEAFLLIAGPVRTGSAIKGRFNGAPSKDIPDFGCFVAGTLVETEDGLRPIEEIELGDYVLSRNERTGEFEYREVVRLFVRDNQQIVQVELEDAEGKSTSIGATVEHPFWVGDQGWVGARGLLPGDEIFTSRGGWLRVKGSTWLSEGQTVYNFEVEGFHNYFVGEAGAWVHNTSRMPNPKEPSIKWDQYSQRWRDVATGQYTKGPKMPKGFGKPSTWKEGTKDVSSEMIVTREGQRVYEKMRDSSIQNDFIGAFEQALKALLNRKQFGENGDAYEVRS